MTATPAPEIIPEIRPGRGGAMIELHLPFPPSVNKYWRHPTTGKQAIHAETGQPFAEVKDGNKEAKT